MAKRNEVVDRDLGYSDLLAGIGKLSAEPAVFVGVREGAGDVDGTPLTLIAAANEFGTNDGHVPERSYLRSTIDEKRKQYQAALTKIITDAIDGRALPVRGLQRLGARAVADVQRKITALKDPPNAPSTVKKKGSDNPLIDTGRLRQSIDYDVRPVGGPKR